MSEPAPFTPPEADLRDFPRMMIDISRLRQSRFDATIDDAAWRAGFNLWFSAWHAVPAGSLASDDASLAKAAGLGRDVRTFLEVKEEAMRGFVLCSDGRLYHDTVCEFVLEAWIEKLFQRISSGAGNAKRWQIEFDQEPIEAAIALAATLLTRLNPESKTLVKVRKKRFQHPTGKLNGSHRDQENLPLASLETGTEKGTGTGTEIIESSASALVDPAPKLRPEHIVDRWNTLAGECGLAKVEVLSDKRKAALNARMREFSLDQFKRVFSEIERSPFLLGRKRNQTGPVATFDFMLQPSSFIKILEGNYRD